MVETVGKPALEERLRRLEHRRRLESSDVKGDFAKLTAAGAKVVREPYRMEGWPPNTWVATLG